MLKKLASMATAAGLLLGSAVPAFATGVEVEVSGNGVHSHNGVVVVSKCSQSVSQSNNTSSSVNVGQYANTGGNVIAGTTGGSANINTGDASNTLNVSVSGGDNTAEVPDCCCGEEGGGTSVLVADNGAASHNGVVVVSKKKSKVKQSAKTYSRVSAWQKANTGKNVVYGTTGAGADIETNDAENEASVDVFGGHNNL